jgi:hypothetical protein
MAAYDGAHFDPPAPVAVVTLRAVGGGGATVGDVELLLDNGADVTLLPRAAVERVGGVDVAGGKRFELMGFDGSRSEAVAVMVEMVFLDRTFRRQYLLIDEERGVLGRDVLNHVAVLLDGPGLRWVEQTPVA